MKCLYCGKKLPMVKKLTAEEFCTVAHRQAYFAEQEKLAVARLVEEQQRSRASRKPLPRKAPVEAEAPLSADFLGERPSPKRLPRRVWQVNESPQFATALALPGLESRPKSAQNHLAGVQMAASAEISGERDVAAALAALSKCMALTALAPRLPNFPAQAASTVVADPARLGVADWSPLQASRPDAPAILPQPITAQMAAVLPAVQLDPVAEEVGALDLLAAEPAPLPLDLSRRLQPFAPSRHPALTPYTAIHFRPTALRRGRSPARLVGLPVSAALAWDGAAIDGQPWLSPSYPERPLASERPAWRQLEEQPSFLLSLPGASELEWLAPPDEAQPKAPALIAAVPPLATAPPVHTPAMTGRTPRLPSLTEPLARVYARPNVRTPRQPKLEPFRHGSFPVRYCRKPATTGGPALLLQRPVGKCQPHRDMALHPVEFLRPVDISLRESHFQFDEPITPRARIASVRRSTLGVTAKTYRNSKLQRLSIHPDSGSRQPHGHDWKPWTSKPIALPKLKLSPVPVKAGHSLLAGLSPFAGIGHQFAWESLKRRWEETPNDLRWVALAVPMVMILLWFSGSKTAQASLRAAVPDVSGLTRISFGEDSLSNLKQNIQRRAAVELVDDFRQGLGEWAGSGDWSRGWSYDPAGFIRPRKLALYTPSLGLEDYRLEFLGAIERKALSWVFRAADVNNYYAARLEVTRGGPLPKVELVRWAVINGRSGPRKSIALPMQTRLDTIYRVRVDVRGNDFVTTVQGQVVDVFSDDRLPRGGVGFFSEAGEDARLRWVEVSHQYDMLGRLCAYLVPYNDSNSNVRSAP